VVCKTDIFSILFKFFTILNLLPKLLFSDFLLRATAIRVVGFCVKGGAAGGTRKLWKKGEKCIKINTRARIFKHL
jgi:hypothetical protein